ncbi:hypothetical protein GGTG_06303 [Gaeumannomyces tritici R3-111a-1]|uniref:CCHC-type domain-containing protein n=1 Tax=Gaeumannomyces tritici (strain R3-111a-1) TaxID=644352 RepID=J3NYF1_GAET3|nr:hypothetical protein GGTG_06303 [Gaeumannomyces tritici R3-111a-1]EJT76384.1 hypothetical protein GGTG_06303 [Gaeumannomyces tritici R3-111a-1]
MAEQTQDPSASLVADAPVEATSEAQEDTQSRTGNKRSREDISLDEEGVATGVSNQVPAADALPPLKRTKQQSKGEEGTPASGSPPSLRDLENPQEPAKEDTAQEPDRKPGSEMCVKKGQDTAQSVPGQKPQEIPAPAPLDWNSGIHKGIRTSFGKTTTAPSFLKSRQRSLVIPAGAGPEPQTSDSSQKTTPRAAESSVDSGASENDEVAKPIPPVAKIKAKKGNQVKLKNSTWIQPPTNSLAMGGTRADYLNYCRMFCAANSASTSFASVKPHLVKRAYKAFLDEPSIPAAVRTQGRRTAKTVDGNEVAMIIARAMGSAPQSAENGTAVEQAAGDHSPTASSQVANAADLTPAVTDQVRPPSGMPYLSREEELRQLRRYFPSASETDFCVWCCSTGHGANDCPPPSCIHCEAQGHTSARCPTRIRCTKCRGLGHSKDECREKLRLAPGEEDECAVCGAADHLENSCESLWRTYYADPSTVPKVRSIAASCYSCGSSEHFGGDCGQGDPTDRIWTLANRDMYVDPESDMEQLSWVPPPPPDEGRPDLGGRSIVPQTHIYYHSDDDEEEGEFIRPSVRERTAQSNGQIRINATATLNGDGSTLPSRPPQPRKGNPPLPPGPPPPLPPQNGRQRAPLRGRGGTRGRGGFSRGRGR